MAREYGVVRNDFWKKPGVRRLSVAARLLLIYYKTGEPTNALGVFFMPRDMAVLGAGLPFEEGKKADDELEKAGHVRRCPKTDFVWLPGYLAEYPPQNGNVWRHCDKLIEAIPDEFTYHSELLEELKPFTNRLETVSKPLPKDRKSPSVYLNQNLNQNLNLEEDISGHILPTPKTQAPDLFNGSLQDAIPPTVREAERMFETMFWPMYPKRVGKKRAKDQFVRETVKQRTPPQIIMLGLVRYKSSRRVKDGYVKDPFNWLREARWTDEDNLPPVDSDIISALKKLYRENDDQPPEGQTP